MNKQCRGSRFVVDGIPYYHCLADSTVVRWEEVLRMICPNCRRPIVAAKASAEIRTVRQVRLVGTTGWFDFPWERTKTCGSCGRRNHGINKCGFANGYRYADDEPCDSWASICDLFPVDLRG